MTRPIHRNRVRPVSLYPKVEKMRRSKREENLRCACRPYRYGRFAAVRTSSLAGRLVNKCAVDASG